MPSCERCWRDSGGNPDRYRELILSRTACTPEEQAGEDAGLCPDCGRKTMHQYVRTVCMNSACSSTRRRLQEAGREPS